MRYGSAYFISINKSNKAFFTQKRMNEIVRNWVFDYPTINISNDKVKENFLLRPASPHYPEKQLDLLCYKSSQIPTTVLQIPKPRKCHQVVCIILHIWLYAPYLLTIVRLCLVYELYVGLVSIFGSR